jgi:hypothetical protein
MLLTTAAWVVKAREKRKNSCRFGVHLRSDTKLLRLVCRLYMGVLDHSAPFGDL